MLINSQGDVFAVLKLLCTSWALGSRTINYRYDKQLAYFLYLCCIVNKYLFNETILNLFVFN